MITRFTNDDPVAREQLLTTEPVGRLGGPSEIADAVVWLCSERSSFVTGHADRRRRLRGPLKHGGTRRSGRAPIGPYRSRSSNYSFPHDPCEQSQSEHDGDDVVEGVASCIFGDVFQCLEVLSHYLGAGGFEVRVRGRGGIHGTSVGPGPTSRSGAKPCSGRRSEDLAGRSVSERAFASIASGVCRDECPDSGLRTWS